MNKCRHKFQDFPRCVFCGALDDQNCPDAVKLSGPSGSVLVDIKPCAICGESVTVDDYRNNAALALKGRGTTAAHLRHFYDEYGATVVDFTLNLEKLVIAYGAEEGKIKKG